MTYQFRILDYNETMTYQFRISDYNETVTYQFGISDFTIRKINIGRKSSVVITMESSEN
jgi:hypothetical protein